MRFTATNSGVRCSIAEEPLVQAPPDGEMRLTWHAQETLRGLYNIDCPQLAETAELGTDSFARRQLPRVSRSLVCLVACARDR